jgi:hypothetical protein
VTADASNNRLIWVMTTHPSVSDHLYRMATPKAPPNPGDQTSGVAPDDLVVDMLAYYIEWRHHEAEVAGAYDRWSSAPADDRALRFSAYMAALDHEEAAAARYAIIAGEVQRASQCPPAE